MFTSLIAWFQPAPSQPRLPPDQVQERYPKFRWQVFEAAFIAYALFYIVRNNFAPVSTAIGEALHYTKSMRGDILLGTSIAYGLGKFFMGFLADRSDSRKYIAVGMLLTAGINFLFGATSSFYGHVFLWTLNGFVQGMGYGPCARGLSHWYSVKERGTIFGFWNISHNIGGGIAGVLAARCAELWGWRSAFYVPGIIAVIGAVYLFWRMRDTPQSEGLPRVEEYKNDWPPDDKGPHEKELTFKEMFFENILPNKMLWILAIANIFVYIARYAMVDWGPTYLYEVKGASLLSGGFSTLVIEFSGAIGMLTMGWLSDKIGGRRARVSVLAMIPLLLAFLGLILSGSLLFTSKNVKNSEALTQKLQSGTNAVGNYVWNQFPSSARQELANPNVGHEAILIAELNKVLKDPALYQAERFAGIELRERTRALLSQQHKGGELIYFNRLLLEDAFPADIERSHFTLNGLLWFNFLLFAVIGFFVYTPVMFSGVMALDLTSKKAAATAAGFVGFFGYLGRVIQGKGLAVIAQEYGWNAGLAAIIGCIVLGILLLALLWNVRPKG